MSVMGPSPTCDHKFVYLRQETQPEHSGFRPDKIVQDLYYCERCLEYKHIEVDRLVPEGGGSGYMSTKHPTRRSW